MLFEPFSTNNKHSFVSVITGAPKFVECTGLAFVQLTIIAKLLTQ
ncbi:protein of unknown function [Vibrio tapetis subsp. tapetis]|uniref:Uncharacterized protein n=1 Tax=Vibrio tapetis subsp. tapetis TaxID=1671868 RepID=A0A2N8ZE67_9VIBR|nr:protein of unknown function [Vibrio tapetis subsp. tapetis]